MKQEGYYIYDEVEEEEFEEAMINNQIHDELISEAQELGKSDFKVTEKCNEKYLLCGTPMAFDDVLEMSVREFIGKMAKEFGIYEQKEELDIDMDMLADVRDKVAALMLNTYDAKVVYGTTQF